MSVTLRATVKVKETEIREWAPIEQEARDGRENTPLEQRVKMLGTCVAWNFTDSYEIDAVVSEAQRLLDVAKLELEDLNEKKRNQEKRNKKIKEDHERRVREREPAIKGVSFTGNKKKMKNT